MKTSSRDARDADISSCACLSPVPRGPYCSRERKREERERKKEQERSGAMVGAMPSTVGLFGPYVVLRREGERGDGRTRSRSSVGHWDVARGRDECGSHLQSVPVGQENHLWVRRILAVAHESTTVKKKIKERTRKDSEGRKKCVAGRMRTN